MKVLLVGECYSENLGDDVICDTVEKILKENYSEIEIELFDMSGKISIEEYYQIDYDFKIKNILRLLNRTSWILKFHPMYSFFKNNEERCLRVYLRLKKVLSENDYDIVLFAGGALFMDYFSGIIYLIIKMIEKNKKINVIFHAIGMGNLSNNSINLLTMSLKSKCISSISLRDSYDKFNKIFGDIIHADQTYDTALCCSRFFDSCNPHIDYGLGLINIPDLYDFQKNLVEYFIYSNLSFKIFTNGATYDEKFVLKILDDLNISKEKQENLLLQRAKNSQSLINNITSFKKIISFRMHSQIIASSYNIPSIGFEWDPKVKEFYKKLGFEKFCFNPKCISGFDELIGNNMDNNLLKKNVHTQGELSRDNLISQMNFSLVKKTCLKGNKEL